jgi:preprotein translocase subunit SecF
MAELMTPSIEEIVEFNQEVRGFVLEATKGVIEKESSIECSFNFGENNGKEVELDRIAIYEDEKSVRVSIFSNNKVGAIGSIEISSDSSAPKIIHNDINSLLAVLRDHDVQSLSDSENEADRQLGSFFSHIKKSLDVVDEARDYGLVKEHYVGPDTSREMTEDEFLAFLEGTPSTTFDGIFSSGARELKSAAEIAKEILATNSNSRHLESGWLSKDLKDGNRLTARYQRLNTGNTQMFDEFKRLGLLDYIINADFNGNDIDIRVPVDDYSETEVHIVDKKIRKEAVERRMEIDTDLSGKEFTDSDGVVSLSVSGDEEFIAYIKVATEARTDDKELTVGKITSAKKLIAILRNELKNS